MRAAYYWLRYTAGFPFDLLLIGFNKCVLVHDSVFDMYEDFVLNGLLADMAARGIECRLHRTDINPLARGFFLSQRKAGENALYGSSFFGDRFYRPSRSALAPPAARPVGGSLER